MTLEPGTTIAGYRIDAPHAQGGMGVVYRATHLGLDRRVALKVIRREVADDPEFRQRFTREAQLAASLDHPHIVSPYDFGEHEQQLYLVMPFVDGADLAEVIERERALAPERTVDLLLQVAEALDAAHALGLVHRDVKPANVLVTQRRQREHALLTDFGIAKRASSETNLTSTSHLPATPGYAAPEQIHGRPVDARTDVYALGCVLYEALTGAIPYPRESPAMMLIAHLMDAPPALAERVPGLPAALDAVIGRALAKDPADRFASAGELVEAARDAAVGTRPAARLAPVPSFGRWRELARVTHDAWVDGVVFSPNGTRIATASGDRTARIWDAASGDELTRLTHDGWVNAVAFSRDGTKIATASEDKTARIWDSASRDELTRLTHNDRVTGVAFSRDGTKIATVSSDRTVHVWDSASGGELTRLTHDSWVNGVAFSPDGTKIATAVDVNTARIWDAAGGDELTRLIHDHNVRDVAFSPDGTRIATACFDNTARLWGAG